MADTEKLLALIIQAKDEASATLQKINNAVIQMGKDADNVNSKQKNWTSALNSDMSKVMNMSNLMRVGVVAAFTQMVKGAIDYGDKINEATKLTGLSAEEMSKLKFAAEQSDVSFEGLTQGLFFLNKNLQDAKNGSKTAQAAFAQVGLDYKKITNSEDAMLALAQAFEEGKITADQLNGGMMALAGRGGKELSKMVQEGRTGIENMMGQAKLLGVVISGEDAKAMDEFNDTIKQITAAILGLSIQFAKVFLPTLQFFANVLTQTVQKIRFGFESIANSSGMMGKIVIAWINLVITSIMSLYKAITHPTKAGEAFKEVKDAASRLPAIIKEAMDKQQAINDSFNSKRVAEHNKSNALIKASSATLAAAQEKILSDQLDREIKLIQEKNSVKTVISGQQALKELEALRDKYKNHAALSKKLEETIEDQKIQIANDEKTRINKIGEDTVDKFIDIWTKGGNNLGDIFRDIGRSLAANILKEGLKPLQSSIGKFVDDTAKSLSGIFTGTTSAGTAGTWLPKGASGPLNQAPGGGTFDIAAIGGTLMSSLATAGIGMVVGGLIDSIIGSFAEVPHYGEMALKAMQDAAAKVAIVWANAINTLNRQLKKEETGMSLWDKLFAPQLEAIAKINEELKKTDEELAAEGKNRADLEKQLNELEQKKIDIAVLGIAGLSGFMTYQEGLAEVIKSHLSSLAGMSEAEKTELDKKKKVLDILAEYSAKAEQLRQMGIAGRTTGEGKALQQAMKDLAAAYYAATNTQIPAMENLAEATANASTAYYEALNAYSAGTLSQDELSKMLDDIKKLQEASGMSQEDIAKMLEKEIEALVANGRLTQLQAEALKENLGISMGVRDALKAQALQTLANTGMLTGSKDKIAEQIKSMGLLLQSNGDIVDENGVLYGHLDETGRATWALNTVTNQLMSAEDRATKATGDLTGATKDLRTAVDNLRRRLETMQGFASGGYISKTQMAVVHAGEYVLPAPIVNSLRGMASGKSGGSTAPMGNITVEVNINGGIITGDAESIRRFYRDNLKQYIEEDTNRRIK